MIRSSTAIKQIQRWVCDDKKLLSGRRIDADTTFLSTEGPDLNWEVVSLKTPQNFISLTITSTTRQADFLGKMWNERICPMEKRRIRSLAIVAGRKAGTCLCGRGRACCHLFHKGREIFLLCYVFGAVRMLMSQSLCTDAEKLTTTGGLFALVTFL